MRDRISWDDVRLLLLVASSGSFRGAAEAAQLSANTLRRRLAALEGELGHVLVARRADGVTLTPEGNEVAEVARRMQEQALELERMARRRRRDVSGSVKVAVTEGLGTFWIIPRLVDFQQQFPEVTIDLWCDMRIVDVTGHEADISIQLERPTASDMKQVRLGYLHLVLFASDDYIRLHGAPTSLNELADYQFVEQVSEQVPSQLLSELVPNPDKKNFVSVRANTSTAHAYAISRGAGIGLLPTYARAITRRVRPINCDFHLSREIWMTYHPKAGEMRHVRAAINWLKEAFDPRQYAWFREEFIRPEDLEPGFIRDNVIQLFEGFLERSA